MRGFAALLVFFVHFSALLGSYTHPHSSLHWATRFAGAMGNAGVDVFFVISGFLMYGIVMHKPTNFVQYFRRRVRRLYPVFVLMLLIYIAISYAVPSESRIPANRGAALVYILANLAVLPGMLSIKPIMTVAWSLSYEWFFYLILPACVWILKLRRWTPPGRIAFVLAVCVLHYLLCTAHLSAHPRLIMFGAGIVIWELGTYGYVAGRLGYLGEIVAIGLAAASLVWVGFADMAHTSNTVTLGNMSLIPSDSPILFVGVFALTLYALYFQGLLNRLFSLPGMRWVGNISYSYYLTHGLTLHVVAKAAHRWLGDQPVSPVVYGIVFLGSLAATLVVAAALFLAVEKPLSLTRPKAEEKGPRSTTVEPTKTWGAA